MRRWSGGGVGSNQVSDRYCRNRRKRILGDVAVKECARCGALVPGISCQMCGGRELIETVRSSAPAPGYAPIAAPLQLPEVPAGAGRLSTPNVGAPRPNWVPRLGALVLGLVVLTLGGVFGHRALTSNQSTSAASTPLMPLASSTAPQSPRSSSWAQDSVSPTSTPTPTPTPVPTPTVDPEVVAKRELDAMIAANFDTVPRNGQWVAMLAGKWIGITDPLQTTEQGSHVFGAVDILAEHNAIKGRVSGASVVLLDSRTFGQYINFNGEPLYVTVALSHGFYDRDAVLRWCAAQFPEFSGAELENRCTSARLTP